MTGLLLVGHGTRSEAGRAQFLWLAERLRQRLAKTPVEPAFLELAEPTIHDAVGRLVGQGIERLITAPLLLFAAGHAKDDVPRAVRAALDGHRIANIDLRQAEHFGCHPAVLELSRLRMEDALAGGASDASDLRRTCHLLVGRGSRDRTATAQMHEYARLYGQATNLTTEVAFMALAEPLVGQQLTRVAGSGYDQVVVQPHLLFHGELVESLERQVAEAQVMHPAVKWLVAKTLADPPGVAGRGTELLESVLMDRCRVAGSSF